MEIWLHTWYNGLLKWHSPIYVCVATLADHGMIVIVTTVFFLEFESPCCATVMGAPCGTRSPVGLSTSPEWPSIIPSSSAPAQRTLSRTNYNNQAVGLVALGRRYGIPIPEASFWAHCPRATTNGGLRETEGTSTEKERQNKETERNSVGSKSRIVLVVDVIHVCSRACLIPLSRQGRQRQQ